MNFVLPDLESAPLCPPVLTHLSNKQISRLDMGLYLRGSLLHGLSFQSVVANVWKFLGIWLSFIYSSRICGPSYKLRQMWGLSRVIIQS